VALSAFAAERRSAAPLTLSAGQQSIDIFCSPAAQQQTRSSGVRRANNGTDGHINGQTDARPLHRLCSAYYVGSANKVLEQH